MLLTLPKALVICLLCINNRYPANTYSFTFRDKRVQKIEAFEYFKRHGDNEIVAEHLIQFTILDFEIAYCNS